MGGAAYSVGAVFYALRRPNPWPTVFGHHEFFHACTLVAALCHHIALYFALYGLNALAFARAGLGPLMRRLPSSLWSLRSRRSSVQATRPEAGVETRCASPSLVALVAALPALLGPGDAARGRG